MRTPDLAAARDLCTFIAGSPSPFHAVEQVAGRLAGAGFDESIGAADGFVRRAGSIVAWRRGAGPIEQFKLMGAHTDSPNRGSTHPTTYRPDFANSCPASTAGVAQSCSP